MFVRSRDHIDKNVSAQDIRDKKREILLTLSDKSEVELRALMSCAALKLHRMKGIDQLKLKGKHKQGEEKFIYEYNSFCLLPRKLVVKKFNKDHKIYNYGLFHNNISLLKGAQSLSTRNEGYKLLK